MENFLLIIKAIAALISAVMLGNWFLVELEKTRMRREPAWKVYLTPPGMLVVLFVIGLPILIWHLKKG